MPRFHFVVSRVGLLKSSAKGGEGCGTTTGAALILRDQSLSAFASYFNNSEIAIQSISLATNYRLGVVYNGANSITTYINNVAGTAATNSAPNFGANGALRVGRDFTTGTAVYWDGPILEIVLVKVAPTTQNLSDLDSYFTGKWGS